MFCSVVKFNVLWCVVLCGDMLSRIYVVLRCAALYCSVLVLLCCCAVLYSALLSTLLYSTLLYSTVPCRAVPCCAVLLPQNTNSSKQFRSIEQTTHSSPYSTTKPRQPHTKLCSIAVQSHPNEAISCTTFFV